MIGYEKRMYTVYECIQIDDKIEKYISWPTAPTFLQESEFKRFWKLGKASPTNL